MFKLLPVLNEILVLTWLDFATILGPEWVKIEFWGDVKNSDFLNPFFHRSLPLWVLILEYFVRSVWAPFALFLRPWPLFESPVSHFALLLTILTPFSLVLGPFLLRCSKHFGAFWRFWTAFMLKNVDSPV